MMLQRKTSIQQAVQKERKTGLRHANISLGGHRREEEATGYECSTPFRAEARSQATTAMHIEGEGGG